MKNKNILIFLGICFLLLVIFVIMYFVGDFGFNNSLQEDVPQKETLNNISYVQDETTGEYIIYNENNIEVMRTTNFLDVENAAKGIIYDPEYMLPVGLTEDSGIQEGMLEPFVEDE